MDKCCKRRLRTNFTETQSLYLEEAFLESHYPDHASKRVMSKNLQIPEDRITVWFQNRRAKWRRIECREKTDRSISIKPSNYQNTLSSDEMVPVILKNSLKNLHNNINLDNNSLKRDLPTNPYHGKIDQYNSYLTFTNGTPTDKYQSFSPPINSNCNYQQYSTKGEEILSCGNGKNSMNDIVNNPSFSINNNMPYVINNTAARMIFNYDDKNCFFG
uniref:Homeobox protein dsc-1 (inferred by orthology to a C. elegans protein) n=1 Tax=Strongyloides venezuelensis TaxID=75913 RepID=A0A0K0FE51_STRVS